jgi:hypothetical protein
VSNELVTREQLLRTLPKRVHGNVTEEMLDNLNNSITDSSFREVYRDNLLSYTNVMQDGRYKVQGYLDAVKYISFKLLGSSNIESYCKTFPDRFQRLVNEGADNKTIAAYASAFNKTQLVNKVFEQSSIPTHILNADVFQKAINVQADLMSNATSETVRTDAANSLLNHLKPPETKKIELDVGIKQDKSLDELRQATLELVKVQREQIAKGSVNAQDIAHSQIIKGEVVEEGELVE